MKGYILKKRYPIFLGNTCCNTFLLIYESEDEYETIVQIVSYDLKRGQYKIIYETKKFGRYVKYLNHRWDLTDNYVLVLYENTGSGSYLTYEVLGCDRDNITKYVSEEFIIFGSIFFKGCSLIRVTSNQYRIWKSINNKMELAPYLIPRLPGTEVIEYSLEGDFNNEETYKVVTDKLQYNTRVGKKIQIIRNDFNDITGNMRVWSNNDCMNFLGIKHGYTIISKCPTTITIQLTAGAYNWDSAVEIKVKAE